MKRIYLLILILSVCIDGFSQKVKISKNVISIDNVNVGKVEKYKNSETNQTGYTYSDMTGENKFNLVRYYFEPDNLFFVLKPNFVADTAEIKMQYLSFTLNEQNGLTDLLIKKYNFFDKNGMNTQVIKEYLSAGNEQQIPLILQKKQDEKLAEQMQKQSVEAQKQVVKNMDISVSYGEIRIRRNEHAGRFDPVPDSNVAISRDNPITIRDEAQNVIANIIANKDLNSTIITYDKKTFDIKTENRYDKARPDFYYREIAEFLAFNEYLKGQNNSYILVKSAYNQMQKERAEERKADLKEKTEVEGILTLKNGTKIDGNFKFDYRQTREGKVAPEGSIADLDAGKIIFHISKDNKGKDKVKKYGVKDVATFYINDGEIYESVTYKSGNRFKSAIAGNSLDVGKLLVGNKAQRFLLQLAVTDKARLYFYEGEYLLMKPDSEDAIAGKTLDTAELAKFTSDCPIISQKVANNEYNNGGNSYIQLVEDYTKCN